MDDYFVPITWAEIEALGEKGIGALGIRAYMVIKMRAYGNRTTSWSSQTRIRKELALANGDMPSLRGLQKAIKGLKDAGLIKVKTHGSSAGTNEYTITNKLVPEQQFDPLNESSSGTPNNSSSDPLNKSSSKEEEKKYIYYINKKGNILDTIVINDTEYNLRDLFNNINDEPNNFYMSHTDEHIEYLKEFIKTISNPDELVCRVVEILISFRDW